MLGFEQDEIAGWGKKIEDKDGGKLVYALPPRKYQSGWEKILVKSGDATQGKNACVNKITARFGNEGDKVMHLDGGRNDDVYRWSKAPFRTHNWFHEAISADWSGYNLFRMDIKSTDAEFEFFLELEDEECEPPVSRRFTIEPGEWVTLETDLKKISAERGIDLKKIFNVWLRPWRCTGATEIFIDNLRLAGKSAPAKLKVLKDESSMKLPEPPKEIKKREVIEVKPDHSPIKPEEPSVIDVAAINKDWKSVMWSSYFKLSPRAVVAFDNNRIGLCYWSAGTYRKLWRSAKAWQSLLWTTDGGKTWKGPEGANKPRYLRQHGHASGSSTSGSDILFVSASGDEHYNCGGNGTPTERMRFRMAKFTSGKWGLTPDILISRDPRHCGGSFSATRQDNGRIWASWCLKTRFGLAQVQTKYSDDGGMIWHSWRPGKIGNLTVNPPGDKWLAESTKPLLTPFGEHVACFWKTSFAFFDGKTWSAPQKFFKKSGGRMNSIVTTGKEKKDIFAFVTYYGGNGVVRHYDGTAWKEEKVPGITFAQGMLTLAGDKVVIIGADSCLYKKPGKKLLMSIRSAEGTWSQAKEVASDEDGIRCISVPVHSPPNFIPIAWVNPKGQKKVLKVQRIPVPVE